MSAQKPVQRRLGRGLSSLWGYSLSQTADSSVPQGTETTQNPPLMPSMASDQTLAPEGNTARRVYSLEIPLNEVVANPHQPRRSFDPNSLAELAVSIKMAGVIQPIIVRKVDSGYQLIAGERHSRVPRSPGWNPSRPSSRMSMPTPRPRWP